MRIGIITGEYPPMRGGVGAYTAILASELAALGVSVRVLSRIGTTSGDPEVQVDSIVESWGVGIRRKVKRWAEDHDLTILNIQYQTAAYNMSALIHFLPDALRPLPVVTTFHDLRHPYLFPKAGRLRDWVVMHLAQASQAVIATNHADANALGDLPAMRMIPIGSNILTAPSFDASVVRNQMGLRQGAYLIGYFGLVNSSKGIDDLLISIADIRAQGIDAHLLLIGAGVGSSDPTNQAMLHTIERQIAALDLRSVIHTTGYLEDADVSAHLAAVDVVALPYRDGASYRRGSLMAAIRCGCAIVTTIPDVAIPTFRDGETMRLVSAGDTNALSTALLQLHAEPELRTRLRAGAATIAHDFDWVQIAEATHETLITALNRAQR